ncbi:hypothetical protein [Aquimarina litoralis]|uniref:hypothetical protein n=1 Tax=Aquimarina litoralis TaxID=584605 RepID=UPI001C589EBB|nr:hypothetical protein [Aquimarina litoralis]MBW1297808.1 hypothetical protein [Aquimarina litoralis]
MLNIIKSSLSILFVAYSISCQSQTNTIKLQEIDNQDLKLLITQLKGEKTKNYNDNKKHFFVNIHKVLSEDYVLIDSEENIYKEFYYLVASSYDLHPSRQAILFKSEDLIMPKIEKVEENEDGKNFNITISVVNPEIVSLKSKNEESIIGKDLNNRISTVVVIPKAIGFKK